jgi:hypothetical protein
VETLVGKARVLSRGGSLDNPHDRALAHRVFSQETRMDLAMAMSMALFSLFVGSSAYFFYKMAR